MFAKGDLPRCIGSASRPSATRGRRTPPRRGGAAERRALWWYRLRGWRILGANVWAGGNELDLVVRRGRQLRFVEVKEKGGRGFGDPLEMVTAEKQRRVRRAAASWLADRPELDALVVGFDVVAVRGGRLERVRDAF
ncbi:MAG TPA: YraN family protein [Gaiellaceae bacterium]|nr:YraN family protein [Gaiellaceae bacterium]